MKKNILTYNDIHSISTSRMSSNGIIVNVKTVAEIIRIEKLLSRLQPMGDDNVRHLWFRVAPGKPEDWGDYEEMKACIFSETVLAVKLLFGKYPKNCGTGLYPTPTGRNNMK